MFKKNILFFMVIFLFVSSKVMAAELVGTVIKVQGNVYAKGKSERKLKRRSKFYLDETIITGKNSKAQLRLRDDTIISIKPDTRYLVSEFNLDAKNPKNNKYVGNLLEGTLMSLSGQGVNSTHNDHKLKTPIVTIAVRGTVFDAGFSSDKKIAWANVHRGRIGVYRDGDWIVVEEGKAFFMTGKLGVIHVVDGAKLAAAVALGSFAGGSSRVVAGGSGSRQGGGFISHKESISGGGASLDDRLDELIEPPMSCPGPNCNWDIWCEDPLNPGC